MPPEPPYILTPAQRARPELQWLERATRLMDNRFRIPGTNLRFGVDFVIGLVPYAGDVISLMLSGMLVIIMARNGASGILVARMLGNLALDTVVGAIPLLGDLFDLGFKANTRNLRLLREHYEEGRHRGSAWPVVLGVLFFVILLIVGIAWLAWWVVAGLLDG
jgi:hypothetical protein